MQLQASARGGSHLIRIAYSQPLRRIHKHANDFRRLQKVSKDFFSNRPPELRRPEKLTGNGKETSEAPTGGRGDEPEKVSDMEWELRVGRAVFLLQSTLPDFFSTGLVASSQSSRIRDLSSSGHIDSSDEEVIYSKNIRLSYTPPLRLPPPIPATLHVEGLHLYQASAAIIRTSLITLYSNCSVDIVQTSILSPAKRERQLKLGMIVQGRSRLTGSEAEWDVRTTYTFSPISGLILHHEIQSIDPAPHSRVYDAFRLSLMRMLGGEGSPTSVGISGPCKLPTAAKPEC